MVPALGTEEGTGRPGTGSKTGKGTHGCSQIGQVSGQDRFLQEVETETGADAAAKMGPEAGAPLTPRATVPGPGPAPALLVQTLSFVLLGLRRNRVHEAK